MTDRKVESSEQAAQGETFLQRFNRRKQAARQQPGAALPLADATPPPDSPPHDAGPVANPPSETATAPPTDADMPPLESLGEASDYRGFLSEKVSESLRKAALRKLFHGSAFNVTDGLDEYAEDFTRFEALGDIVTADMRHLVEVEARKKAAALEAALTDAETADQQPDDPDQALPAAQTGAQPALPDDSAEPQQASRSPAPGPTPIPMESTQTDEPICQTHRPAETSKPGVTPKPQ